MNSIQKHLAWAALFFVTSVLWVGFADQIPQLLGIVVGFANGYAFGYHMAEAFKQAAY
jgi:uncharacterized membrane protein required for colicin V production